MIYAESLPELMSSVLSRKKFYAAFSYVIFYSEQRALRILFS